MSDTTPPLDFPPPKPAAAVIDSGARTPLYWAIYIVVSCGLLFLLASGISPALQTAADAGCRAMRPKLVDKPAPELVLEDLQGQRVSLKDTRRFVVLNFWATWCEPCLEEWPDLARLAERVADNENIEVWAVSIDEDRQAVRDYLQQQGLEGSKVRVLFDPTHEAHRRFGSEKIPDTYFVTPQGQIQSVFVNVRNWGKPEAQRCVETSAQRAS